ncbi:MAG: ribonuclease D [Dehalococcoidia bacterium]|nr:ribonuclease D [Dehalococcoidia bacterium]
MVTVEQQFPTPVTNATEVASIAVAIARAGWFALDLEFMTEGRYVADLSLVQVGWGDHESPTVAAIDPLEVDARPVIELVARDDVEVVLHSAQADLALIGAAFGVRATRVFDTQIAAAFLGLGEQIGYGALVERMAGVRLDKGAQYTEWSRRPLSDDQLRYALDDVRYLPAVWLQLRQQLESRGRTAWVQEECDLLADAWAERTPPDEMYRRVRGWNGLKRRSLGALRAVAAWREQEALRTNRPPSWIMNDRSLLELARRPPREAADLGAVRGLGEGTVQRYGAAILEVVERGVNDPPEDEATPPRLPNLGQAWPAILSGIVQARCCEAEIAARFVATRHEMDEMIAWWLTGDRAQEPQLPLLRGWRRELAGRDLLDWLRGETTVAVDMHTEAGVRIQR